VHKTTADRKHEERPARRDPAGLEKVETMNLYTTPRRAAEAVRALAGKNGPAGGLSHSEFYDRVKSGEIQIVKLGRRSLVPLAQSAKLLRVAN
jgi:hypothetical protein